MKQITRIETKNKVLTFPQFNIKDKELIINAIVSNLTPDLLAENRFIEENKINPMFGHCYHSSQAFYYMIYNHNYQPIFAFNDYRGGTHWWLQSDEEIIDITVDQYYRVGMKPPYENGSPKTWKISRRSLKLVKRVLETLSVGYFEKNS